MDCHSYNTNATMSRCFLLHNIDVNLNVLLISYLLLYFNSTYLLKHGSNNQNSLLLSNRKVLSNEVLKCPTDTSLTFSGQRGVGITHRIESY